MSARQTTVAVTGKESAYRETAYYDACQTLERHLLKQGLEAAGDVQWTVHEPRPGRFYAVARVAAVPVQ